MRTLVLALFAALLLAAAPAAHAAATKLTITGAGFGHGIGMSQYGTYGYSLHLKSYDYILGHEGVVMWTGEEILDWYKSQTAAR